MMFLSHRKPTLILYLLATMALLPILFFGINYFLHDKISWQVIENIYIYTGYFIFSILAFNIFNLVKSKTENKAVLLALLMLLFLFFLSLKSLLFFAWMLIVYSI